MQRIRSVLGEVVGVAVVVLVVLAYAAWSAQRTPPPLETERTATITGCGFAPEPPPVIIVWVPDRWWWFRFEVPARTRTITWGGEA